MALTSSIMDEFNLSTVENRIFELLKTNCVDKCREIYSEEIMDWTDNYSENLADAPDSTEAKIALACIASLWISYSNMEIALGQNKKAVQVYENASVDPVVGKSIDIYISYANWYISRGKIVNAQKVYIKGLCANIQSLYVDKLWLLLLKLLKNANNDSNSTLNLEKLYNDVLALCKKDGTSLSAPSVCNEVDLGNSVDERMMTEDILMNEYKQSKSSIDNSVSESKEYEKQVQQQQVETVEETTSIAYDASYGNSDISNNSISTECCIPSYLSNETDIKEMKGMTPEVLRRVHHNKSPTLFLSHENVLKLADSIQTALSIDERNQLQRYLGAQCQVDNIPVFTCKKCNNALDNECNNELCLNYRKINSMNNNKLDVIESLYYIQVMKEKHCYGWLLALDNMRKAEESSIPSTGKDAYQSRYSAQLELLHATINRIMHLLLIDQLKILIDIGFPYCNIGTIERVEACISRSLYSNAANEFDKALVLEVEKISRLVNILIGQRILCHTTQDFSKKSSKKMRLSSNSSGGSISVLPPPPPLVIPR